MNLNYQFYLLRATRSNILKVVKPFSNSQLNSIPSTHNNNLAWNLGHVLVTQQLLCYKLSGVDLEIPSEWIDKYRKGTKPETPISEHEISQIIDHFGPSIDQLEEKYNAGYFTYYQPYETSFGIKISSAAEAIAFNLAHETMHLGTMLTLRKLI